MSEFIKLNDNLFVNVDAIKKVQIDPDRIVVFHEGVAMNEANASAVTGEYKEKVMGYIQSKTKIL